MRLRLAGAVLLSAAAYYVYLPLPSGVSEPWKLMLLDALFRSFMQAVRAEGWRRQESGGGQVDVRGKQRAVRAGEDTRSRGLENTGVVQIPVNNNNNMQLIHNNSKITTAGFILE